MKTAFIDLGDYIYSMEVKESREELIRRLGTREDGRFLLYDLEELENLIKSGNNKSNWYCLGREHEKNGKYIDYCEYGYAKKPIEKPLPGCTADCKFYKKLHRSLFGKIIDYFKNIIPKPL